MILYFSTILYAPVAQSVEHLTFNQGVRDSSSRRSTKKRKHPCGASFFSCGTRIPLICYANKGMRIHAPRSDCGGQDSKKKVLIFYLSLTIFFLNAIMVNIMLEIINRIIEIIPKPATLLKE